MSLTKLAWVTAMSIALIVLPGCGGPGTDQNPKPAEKIAAQAEAQGPMPASAFKAAITLPEPPATLQPSQKIQLRVKIKNVSDTVWPAHGRKGDGFFQVNLGDKWFDSKNNPIEKHPYLRSGMPRDLKPGEEVEISLDITAPSASGEYTLQIDLVQEMVSWFGDRGSATPRFKIKIGS